MTFIFEVIDKNGKSVYLTHERWKHIARHPSIQEFTTSTERMQLTLTSPTAMCTFEKDDALYFYRAFKEQPPEERYLLVAVKYLNGKGFVITSFYTDRIEGVQWNKK